MSRKSWSVLLAAIGVIVLSIALRASLNPEKPSLSGNVGYHEHLSGYHAGGYKCQPAWLNTLSGRARDRQQAACADAEQNDRYNANNLIQYRRAADAADASAIFAYQQTRIAAWGAALGLVTMFAAIGAAWYARDAAEQGRRGAKAAEDALGHAREAGERQDRAYIAVQPGGINQTKSGRAVGDVIIKNSGSTPAHNVRTFLKIEIKKTKRVKSFPVPGDQGKSDRTVQPGDCVNRSSPESLILDRVNDAAVYIYVWGIVHYFDVFGEERFTRFCHRYPGARVQFEMAELMPGKPNLGLAKVYSNNLIDAKEARHHQYGNDAD